MKLTRRNFLKLSSFSLVGFFQRFFDVKYFQSNEELAQLKTKFAYEKTTICPYCSVGCGLLMMVKDGQVVHIQGDPDHPVNQGTLCAKGGSLRQLIETPKRLKKPLYRPPYSQNWREISWEKVLKKIAHLVKKTRDKTFISQKGNYQVNQTRGIAALGGAVLNNEECYLYEKLMKALGLVYIEHQARICCLPSIHALTETFGYGAMSNHWIDLKNSEVIMIIGSNPASNHPVAFRWIEEAQDRGARLICVDPRFTRTASKADLYLSLREGTDVAFIGGLINYCLTRNLYDRHYLLHHTNASFIIQPQFEFPQRVSLGYNKHKRGWPYQLTSTGEPQKDPTLQHPQCVFQILKRHFAKYTVERVRQITGVPVKKFLEVAKIFCSTGQPGRVGTILYATGATQHTTGTQNIRSYAILQLLLGNLGLRGGGVNVLRGAANAQGASDHGLLFHLLPGYLKNPQKEDFNLKTYRQNYGVEKQKYLVNLLKSFWGKKARVENDFCYAYLSKINSDCSYLALFNGIEKGEIEGLLILGQNPNVSSPDLKKVRRALENLKWLVVADLWETETTNFWQKEAEKIATEVFLLPVASFAEKEGSITNSARWVQWRNKIIEPKGESRSDLWILDRLFKEITSLYRKEKGVFPDPILNLNWNYGEEIKADLVAREINGYDLKTGRLISSHRQLKNDGSTSAGNWLYAGSFTEVGNMMKRRGNENQWGWAWPNDERILYAQREKKNSFPLLPEKQARLFLPQNVENPLPEHYEPLESPIRNIFSLKQISPTLEDKKNQDLKKFPIIATTYRLAEHWQTGTITRNLPWLAELKPGMFVEISETLAREKKIKSGDKVKISSLRGEITAYARVTPRLKPFFFHHRKIEQIALPYHYGFWGEIKGESANVLTAWVREAETMIPEYKVFLCQVEKIEG
jgi:formate dehydrogenase major subunit